MANKLIDFVRARLDYEDLPHFEYDKLVGSQEMRDAIREIVDAYESADRDAAFPDYDGGFASGLGDAVVALAGIWRDHPDWRDGDEWWR